MTATQAAKQNGMCEIQLLSCDNNGVKYFDGKWLKEAREIVKTEKGNIG